MYLYITDLLLPGLLLWGDGSLVGGFIGWDWLHHRPGHPALWLHWRWDHRQCHPAGQAVFLVRHTSLVKTIFMFFLALKCLALFLYGKNEYSLLSVTEGYISAVIDPYEFNRTMGHYDRKMWRYFLKEMFISETFFPCTVSPVNGLFLQTRILTTPSTATPAPPGWPCTMMMCQSMERWEHAWLWKKRKHKDKAKAAKQSNQSNWLSPHLLFIWLCAVKVIHVAFSTPVYPHINWDYCDYDVGNHW